MHIASRNSVRVNSPLSSSTTKVKFRLQVRTPRPFEHSVARRLQAKRRFDLRCLCQSLNKPTPSAAPVPSSGAAAVLAYGRVSHQSRAYDFRRQSFGDCPTALRIACAYTYARSIGIC